MVRMAERLSFGPGSVDWQGRIDQERLRRERAERARMIMKRDGVPTLLVTSPAEIRYLTGCTGAAWDTQLFYTLFFVEHDPIVFHHGGDYQQSPHEVPWIKNWRVAHCYWMGGSIGEEGSRAEAKVFAEGILQELRERGVEKEKVGVVGFDAYAQEALKDAGIKIINASQMLVEMKAIKSIDEINCLKMVANICEHGWWKVWENLRPGMRDMEVWNIAISAFMEGGAEGFDYGNGIYSGPLSFSRGMKATNRFINTGDLVYMPMCHVVYNGYVSCTYRTLIAGRKPNQKEKDWYKTVLERVDNAIDAMKPGVSTAEIAEKFAPASKWGYKEEAEVSTIEFAHGIGISGYNIPIINRQFSFKYPQIIEENMAVAIECLEGEDRVGGCRLENMVIVTKNGAEVIDHMPREEIWPAKYSF
jgi:Xaa-Pro aminopeptidase